MIVYLNGSWVDAAEARVSLFDGGYLYGDGVYETLRLYGGRPFDLAGHLGRLSRELELLGYTWRPDPEFMLTVLAELAERNGLREGDARVRITVSRGGGPDDPLPLADFGALPPTLSVWALPLPTEIARWQEEGIAVRIVRPPFGRGNFPQLKTLNYLPPLMAQRFARQEGCDEAILTDRQGKLLEGAASNLFIVRGDRLVTPPTRLGLLAGRTRSLVMSLAPGAGLTVEEAALDRRDLLTADEAFLSGSVREIVPLVRADHAAVGRGRPGERTRDLQERYRRTVREGLPDAGADRAARGSAQ